MIDITQIEPPRPRTAVAPSSLSEFDSDWIAQPKLDGQFAMVRLHDPIPCRKITFHGKTGQPVKRDLFEIAGTIEQLRWLTRDLPAGVIFLAELRIGKHGARGIMLHDIVAYSDQWLGNWWLGNWTMIDRYNFLRSLFPMPTDWGMLLDLKHGLSIARLYSDISLAWDIALASDDAELEGVVLKRKSAKLGAMSSGGGDWQVKCRKPSKQYSF